MAPFLIGLDLDGVCYQYEKTARYMIRRRMEDRGETPPYELSEPSQSWNWIREYAPAKDWDWLWAHGTAAGLYRYGHVVSGSIEGVQALNELGDVVVITARPKDAVHDTMVWLSTMFDKAPLSGLVIQSGNGQKKSDVQPAPDVFIDDAKHNADDLLRNTSSHVVLFDQPWNQDYVPWEGPKSKRAESRYRFERASGWREVVSAVRRLAAA
jgi:5'(3')-deoxyribonucleotidase